MNLKKDKAKSWAFSCFITGVVLFTVSIFLFCYFWGMVAGDYSATSKATVAGISACSLFLGVVFWSWAAAESDRGRE